MYTETLKIAQAYMDLGYAVFPINYVRSDGTCSCGRDCGKQAGKHPACRQGFKVATKDIETFKGLMKNLPDYNIAVATGEVSGIWTLDDDDVEANRAIMDRLPETVCFKTGSGNRQFVFRYDENSKDLKLAQKVGGHSIDVRPDGGYAILPPSNHVKGSYEWIVSPDEMEPSIAPGWLIEMLPKTDKPKAEKAKTQKDDSAATRQNRSGETFHVGDEMEARAKEYLAECEPAIEGEGGMNRTFKIACYLIEHFGCLSDETLLDCMEDWNNRCEPPWTEKELRRKLSDARKKTEYKGESKDPQDNQNIEDDKEEHEAHLEPEFPSLGNEAYQGLFGEIVKTIEPETEADPAGVMLSLLTAFSNVVGNRPRFTIGSGQQHCNLFGCIVGNTASGKGQAWSIAKNIMQKADADWATSSIERGLSSGEGLIERVSDDAESPHDAPEELKRLMVIEEEFGKPLTVMRREGNTLSKVLISAWDNEKLACMNRGKNKLFASSAYISILGHITPDELKSYLKNSLDLSNGFCNRFLFGCVRSSKDLPHGGNHRILDRFTSPMRDAIARAKSIGVMERSEEANRLWEIHYARLKHSNGKAAERGAPQVVRLSMLFALVDGSATICRDHLKAALAVWDYCEASARWLFGGNDSTPSDPVEAKIIEGILEALEDGPKTKTAIRDRLSSSKQTRKLFPTILESLLASGKIEMDGQQYRLSVVRSARSVRSESGNGQNGQTGKRTEAYSERANGQNGQTDSGYEEAESEDALVNLIDWRNLNGIEFTKRSNGLIWVSNHYTHLLTPSLESAIRDHQTELEPLAVADDDKRDQFYKQVSEELQIICDGDKPTLKPKDTSRAISADEFLAELRALNEE
ncbi:bifunctional DNA primase/polymerase [Bremerella sp. T1]|uniref:bifunctional DNA primase/polymerase n=1 Tax=Bremerella sp. TYQ1 TaxID=3119568 RepID=UPI001CCB90D6|nr:bifunctional DNA primase/polymerase [Bremerella volcania]UBM38386.1 bifunctional DNA primase/polymerase [Bremerella volcania]